MLKEYLQRNLESLKTKRQKLTDALIASDNQEKRAELGETLRVLANEIKDAEDALAAADQPAPNQEGEDGERKFTKLGEKRGSDNEENDVYSTLEYRKAFRNFLASGKIDKEYRASSTTANVSAVIPTNLINQILEKFEQLGVIYNLVTKTSYPVGQKIPVDGVKPTATWVTEGAGSTPQSKTLTSTITFTHHKLRCEVRYTEEVSQMALPAFEALFVKQVGEAMLRAQEAAIVDGDGSDKPTGILNYAATLPAEQKITIAAGATNKLTYKTLCDAEAAIPVQYEGTAKWLMTKKTFMAFVGITDSAGQPIARVNHGINGKPERTLLGRDVIIYVPQAGSKLGSYQDSVTADTIFAVIVDFGDYVLNTNYNLGIKHATDWDNEDHKTKAVLACDGKLLVTDSLVVLTKSKAAG